jgi:hypothetical protein
VLPPFQGRGLGKILKAAWLGYVYQRYPRAVITGHSTAPAMARINEMFGAQHLRSHANWYGTNRTARFYVL